jgi:hypothetical protein
VVLRRPETVETLFPSPDAEILHRDSAAASLTRDPNVEALRHSGLAVTAALLRSVEIWGLALNAQVWEDAAEPVPSAPAIGSACPMHLIPDVPPATLDPPPTRVIDSPHDRSGTGILSVPNPPAAVAPYVCV